MTNDENGELQMRELSKLEQQYLNAARERQKNNITQKQIVWGKEFKGQAFIPEPKEVIFKDFELEKNYSKTITLTNASFSFNTFKILPLKSEIANFFEISYKLPGKMSAGTSCNVTIKFTPRVRNDIDDEISCLAETGPFSIPLRCFTKKVVISIIPKSINFGSVVLAESRTIDITIQNDGALATAFRTGGEAVQTFGLLKKKIIDKDVVPEVTKRVLQYSAKAGIIEPFSHHILSITYLPTETLSLSTILELMFEDKFTNNPVTIPIEGMGQEVPIYVQPPALDFACAYYNTLYRDVLKVHNRGKVSMKIKIKAPPEFSSFVEFVPNLGFVQTSTPYAVQVKFKPVEGILDQCKLYVNRETGMLEVPIRICVPDQVMPVFFKIRAIVTSSLLEITPALIDFGKVSIEETVTVPITVKNHSILSQRFGFVKMLQEILITPNFGFAHILPGESMNFQINFSPKAAIEHNFKLECKNERGEVFHVACTAVGIVPPIKFETPLLKLAAVARGDFVLHTFQIINNSKESQEFQFVTPENSGVTLLPDRGIAKANQKTIVEFNFQAPKHDIIKIPKKVEQELAKSSPEKAITAPPTSKSGKIATTTSVSKNQTASIARAPQTTSTLSQPNRSEEVQFDEIDFYRDWESSLEDEPWSKHKTWSIPCYIRNCELGAIFLEARATVVAASLILLENDIVELNELDFGNVPIFQQVQKSVTLKNTSDTITKLKVKAMESSSPFSILQPPKRSLGSGESCIMCIEFFPKVDISSSHIVQIFSSQTNKVQLSLKGVGQSPALSIEPMVNVIEMGDVVCGDTIDYSMALVNNCNIEVPFEISFIEEHTHPFNYDRSNPFLANPSCTSIPIGGRVTVSLSFAPDHEFIHYRSICKIKYGGKIHEKYIAMRGRCWKPGPFVVFGETLKPIDKGKSPFEVNNGLQFEDPFAVLLKRSESMVQYYQYVFENVNVGEKRVFAFEIGFTKSAKLPKADYAFDSLTDADARNGFSIDSLKGVINAGTKKEITCTFAPTKETIAQIPVPGVDVWVECRLKCVVKEFATKEFSVVLRGQVKQDVDLAH